MPNPTLTRRHLIAAAAAIAPLQHAVAATAAASGDWMDMIQAHHALIAKTFDELLAAAGRPAAQSGPLIKKLGYRLTAHSVAEENVLYPALAMHGMAGESDKLYIDQAHAKVMNTQLEMEALHGKGDGAWADKARALQAAVLKHAKEDEEGNLYPKLKQKLDAATNALLTKNYQREFNRVKPA